MAGRSGTVGAGAGEPVVGLEDAVKMLVERLVEPVLTRRDTRREAALAVEKHEAVARQVHAAVLIYNYYHRKQFPHLEFADPDRFSASISLTAGEGLLEYMKQIHDGGSNGDERAELTMTNEAVVDACGIAEALDATMDAPEVRTWPISKVAVLLLNPTRKRCMIEYGAVTSFVWSILEKDITTTSSNSHSTELLSSKAVPSEPYMLQQTAYSLVESKTGMERTSLCFLEEHLVYSLGRKEATAKLFVVQYEQIDNEELKKVNDKLKEVPLEDLIRRMSGPIFRSDPYHSTTSAVEFYHILPYKDVLLNLLNRERSLESSQSAAKDQNFHNKVSSLQQSDLEKSFKGEGANSNLNLKKSTRKALVIKKVQVGVREVHNNNCTNSKNIKNNNLVGKRKSEALEASPLPATFTEDPTNAEVNTQEVDPIMKNCASESQIVKVRDISGCVADNKNDQLYASLQTLQKMRDDILREHCILGDRSAQLDMDIQAILTEGEMTSSVMSILKRYENKSFIEMKVATRTNSGEGYQTVNMKRRRLTEAILLRNKCQELDAICRENNWTLPRYIVLPASIDGLYQSSVHLICPDLEMSANGDMKTTPREARESAATNILYQLQKAKENLVKQDS